MESYQSEGELLSKMKLLNKKSYSAPYIIFSDLYPEQLHDNEEDMLDEDKANSTTMMQNIELQM